MNLWRRIEAACLQAPPPLLTAEDYCYFAREYQKWQDYKAGLGNDLIKNFKIKPTVANYAKRKFYKDSAVRQFANELAQFLPQNSVIAYIPTSKRPDDAEYDPRFEMLFAELKRVRADVQIVEPWEMVESHQAVHEGGNRSQAEFYARLKWKGMPAHAGWVFLIDDVITDGCHFKACQQLCGENGFNHVAGVFWGVAVNPPPPKIEFNIDQFLKNLPKSDKE